MRQFLNLAVARLFHPEACPREPFEHSMTCSVLVAVIALSILTAMVLT